MNKFRPILLTFAFVLACIVVTFSQQQQLGKHLPKAIKGKEHLIDTRIDNMTYWRHMADMGYVEVAPVIPIPPAKFTGSTINSRSVVFDDSPDVPVTEENSTQSENSIFVNPNDNQNVLNSNNSTDYPFTQIYGANDFYSFDQGETWDGELQGAGGSNSGDPAAVISNTGTYYVGYIHSNYGQGVSYSNDQGQTWTPVYVASAGGGILDKNHLWIDNSLSSPYDGYLYDAWTDLGSGSPNYGDIEIARTIDGGLTWLSDMNISQDINAGSHNQGVNIHTGPGGEVYAAWSVYDSWPSDETAIGFARSFNGGETFEHATRIFSNINGIRTTETSKNHRVNSFPSMAVDRSGGEYSGTIYIVWANIGVPGINTGPDIDIYLIKSSDQGETWSDAIRVNQDPSGLGKEHYFPWITCDPVFGTLSVIFYDDRNVASNQAEVFCAVSSDGSATWEDFKVSDVSFTPSPIPGLAGGYMGDYLGISSQNRMVYPCWTDNRLGHTMTFVSPFVTGPPPDQPWVIYDSHQIDDSQGNNNGEVDFGETILLNFTMKNIGDQPATDVTVTLSTETHFVTLTDDSENFGDMAVEELKNIDGAFSFEVSDSIPNGTSISFNVTAVDASDSTFISGFAVQANAPALIVGNLTVVDLEGNNNGRLDPGETADIIITTSNPGAFDANNTLATLTTTSPDVTLNTTSFELNTIEAGGTSQAVFNLTVNDEAMIGSAVDLNFYVSSDYHFSEKMFIETIGLILEDYETGDFSGFNWMDGGNAAWEITSEEAYEGMYSAKSGAIGNYSTSELYIEYDVMFDDSISFFRKVSSEANYDYLEFYIDETLIEMWAGEADWERKAYPVSAGSHTFSWIYSKDASVSNGDDCGWIDYIIFPPELRTTAYAGADDVSCETTTYQLGGNATHFESLLWTTSGSGVFDDASALNPVYTPSEDDLAAGSVELTLTVYGPTETISDGMILTITMNPVAYAGDDTSICEGEDFTVTTASAENYTELLWSTTGDGTFNNATILMPVYTPGENDILEENVILMLTASNQPCLDAISEFTIDINPLPSPEISGEEAACQYVEGIIYSTQMVVGSSYYWEITGGEILEGQETNEVSVVWNEPGEGMLILTETNDETLCESTVDYTVTVNEVPVPLINGNDDVCMGEADVIYYTSFIEGHTYEWSITGGILTTPGDAYEVTVTWEEVGEGELMVIETISETGCMETTSMAVNVNPLPTINLNDTSMCHNHVITLDAGNPDAQSWEWSTGETTQTIEVDSSGVGFSGTKDISVIVTSANDCISEKSIVVTIDDCSGIGENLYKLDVNLFPNPNTGTFTIELKAEQNDLLNLKIVDARGAVVFEEKEVHLMGIHTKTLNLNDLQEGIYYLLIDSDKVHVVKKVVIQR